SGRESALTGPLPLGGARLGSVVLLLRFPTPWGNRARISSAFVTLTPTKEANAAGADVPIRVARLLSPWEPSQASSGRQPKLARSELLAKAPAGPPRTLRIDVTALIDRWQRALADDQGIALLVDPVDATGASFDIGSGSGNGSGNETAGGP